MSTAESFVDQENAWFNQCKNFFENSEDNKDLKYAIEYFQGLAPDGSAEGLHAGQERLGQAGIPLLNLLDAAGLRGVMTPEKWYLYNEIKNKARQQAHASGTARRLESTKSTIETISSHSRHRCSSYADASKALSQFLRAYAHEPGLAPVIHGLQKWVRSNIGRDFSFDYSIPGEVFSERKIEFTESYCLVLCQFGTLVAISDKDFNDCDFVWRFHPHFSDKYSTRVVRRISRLGLAAGKRSLHYPGQISESVVIRGNIHGQKDSLYQYTINALLCPIL